MPVYEYACRKCGKKFSEVMTMKEHETGKFCVRSVKRAI